MLLIGLSFFSLYEFTFSKAQDFMLMLILSYFFVRYLNLFRYLLFSFFFRSFCTCNIKEMNYVLFVLAVDF